MSKKITISEQIDALQVENERLQMLHKLFEKAVKAEFGLSIKDLHKLVDGNLQK